MSNHVPYDIEELVLSVPAYDSVGEQTPVGKITIQHQCQRGKGFMNFKIDTGPAHGGPPPANHIEVSVPVMALLQAIDTIRKA